MCKICQKCGSVAEYNAYYGRVTCTKCAWGSDNISAKDSKNLFKCFEQKKVKIKVFALSNK